MGNLRTIYGESMDNLWKVYGESNNLWKIYGESIYYLWIIYGKSTGNLCEKLDIPFGVTKHGWQQNIDHGELGDFPIARNVHSWRISQPAICLTT